MQQPRIEDRVIAWHLIVLFVLCASAANVAHAEAITGSAPRLEVDFAPTQRSSLAVDPLGTTVARLGAVSREDGLRARLWWGHGRLAVGAGADWTTTENTASPMPSGLAAAKPRFALEFRAKNLGNDLRENLLRVQMSANAALHFKPRSHGLQVTYRERF